MMVRNFCIIFSSNVRLVSDWAVSSFLISFELTWFFLPEVDLVVTDTFESPLRYWFDTVLPMRCNQLSLV